MASGILGTGVSGLLAAQRQLSVVSNNIANVNTEGYSRQRVNLEAREPERMGDGFAGTGVTVSSIQRIYDEFSVAQLRTTTSAFAQAQQYQALTSQIDNLLGSSGTGIMPAVQNFFDAIQEVSGNPTSQVARQVMLSEANNLAAQFHNFDQQLDQIRRSTNAALVTAVGEVNSLAASIADINRRITDIGVATGAPNDLLDRRDDLIRQLSERVAVTTVTQDDGSVNVFIGSGQALVAGGESRQIMVAPNMYDSERLEVAYAVSPSPVVVTEQLNGGKIGGILEFRNQVLDPTQNALGQMAIGIAATFNEQHALGMDLSGNLGGDFFVPIDTRTAPPTVQILPGSRNSGLPEAQISAFISDAGALTASDYRLERTAGAYVLTRLSDNKTVALAGFPAGAVTVDGMALALNAGAMAVGDSFLIRPTRDGAKSFGVAIGNPSLIAAAAPLRTSASLGNTGTGGIGAGVLSDPGDYSAETFSIIAVDATAAAADGGATRGIVAESGGNNSLQYELRINNVLVYVQDENPASALAGLDALANAVNTATAQTGVRAYVNAGTLYLANVPQSALPITVRESLNTLSGAAEDADTAVGYFSGAALTGASNAANTMTFSGAANSYVALDGSAQPVASGAYVSGAGITVNGIRTTLSGVPNLGDVFTIAPNVNGVGDNRNALALAGLQTRATLNNGTASYDSLYGGIVADVGNKAHQADINLAVQDSMFSRAVEAREAVSGVNLDEEAAAILRFQQSYQAAAQLIATANTLFETLMAIVRR